MNKYRSFLIELGQSMIDALGECENLGFHHCVDDSPEFKHYLRLVTMVSHVAERLGNYDYIKAKGKVATPERATAQTVVDRYLDQRGHGERDAGRRGLDGNTESIRQARLDTSPHHSHVDDSSDDSGSRSRFGST